MYHDVLQPGDTFPMMMRKMVMAVSAFIGIVPMLILIQKIMGLSENNSSSYPRFSIIAVIMIGSWIYVKWTHTAPIWLVVCWTNSMSTLCLVNILNNPNGPNEFNLIAIMLIVLLCKVHIANLIAPLTALLVFAYNFSLGRGSLPLIMLQL